MNDNKRQINNSDGEYLGNRERRKLIRKCYSESKRNSSNHEDNGVNVNFEKDVCDCLSIECPGCHFPCPKCRSCKCGLECRINRKWNFETIECEGYEPCSKIG